MSMVTAYESRGCELRRSQQPADAGIPRPWHNEHMPAYLFNASNTSLDIYDVASKSWEARFRTSQELTGEFPAGGYTAKEVKQYASRLWRLFDQRRVDYDERVRRATAAGWNISATMRRLYQDGLVAYPVGLDFTRVQHKRYEPSMCAHALRDIDVQFVSWLLVQAVPGAKNPRGVSGRRGAAPQTDPPVDAADVSVGRVPSTADVIRPPKLAVSHILWERDQPLRHDPCSWRGAAAGPLADAAAPVAPSGAKGLHPRPNALVASLQRKGHARVQSWGASLDLAELRRQAAAEFRRQLGRSGLGEGDPSVGALAVPMAALPALTPLLHDPSVAAILRAYLGGAVRYDGHVLLRLTNHVTTRNYSSSAWQ